MIVLRTYNSKLSNHLNWTKCCKHIWTMKTLLFITIVIREQPSNLCQEIGQLISFKNIKINMCIFVYFLFTLSANSATPNVS